MKFNEVARNEGKILARRSSGFTKMVREMERENKRRLVEQARMEREELKRKKVLEKERLARLKEEAINYAESLTEEAKNDRESILSLLNNLSTGKFKFKWNDYKDLSDYSEKLILEELPQKPKVEEYKGNFNLFEKLIPSLKSKKEQANEGKYNLELQKWEVENSKIEQINAEKFKQWKIRKKDFEKQQAIDNEWVDEYREFYENSDSIGVEFYFSKALENNKYPTYYLLDYELEYNKENKIMIVEYKLPKKQDINNIKQVKYVQTRKEFTETYIKENEINKIYEESLYQLCLRINNDIYVSDKDNKINGIVFNGYLTDINKINGIEETKCILSLQTEKNKFESLNLENVDPKMCFKSLKGIAGAKLCDLIAVAPIATINSEDKRFVESREIGEKISGYNLASMYWEDFEHLIRELFEKEFSSNGSEVKVTQASRDGGVDAIMFDPDPIKGGKYIIQAKRYTNVVGVSAVRDLYGTVLNEGASKGILVTTSDYGADSYEFAKDKPLTLLNGSNLLHMLERHGYEARIDLREAKVELNKLKDK